jgi:hypothetical protein
MNEPLLRMTWTRSRASLDLARYVRAEYRDDDPTWLLSQNRAPKGARSFSPHRAPRLAYVRRAVRAFAAMLL